MTLQDLANAGDLGGLLSLMSRQGLAFRERAHWTQGEFHHDLLLELEGPHGLSGPVVLVATNCNGAIKEVLSLAEMPDRWGLWHARCPDNPEFEGPAPKVLEQFRTAIWFDPCFLLRDATRSEYRPECRRRQRGGGWELAEE
ncbi:MAG: hypothetical protein RLY93_01330 [Sumerlaeia bacterium]